jgi:beta-phosphoglucomutase
MKFNQHTVKGVIFDLDGVLVDTEYFHWQGWVEVLKPYGKSLSQREYLQYAGKQGDIIEAELIKKLKLPVKKNELLERKKALVLDWITTKPLHLMPFAEEGVQYFLKKNITVACASGSLKDEALLKLQKGGLLPLFPLIISGSDVKRGKPFPDTYLLTAKKMGLNPEDCLAFEDTQYGVASAKLAGMVCIAIPNEFSQGQDFSQADGVFSNLQEVIVELSKS